MQVFCCISDEYKRMNSLRRVCCGICHVLSDCHHLLSLETSIFIKLWELQHPSSLRGHPVLSLFAVLHLLFLVSGACESAQTGLGMWTNLYPQILNFDMWFLLNSLCYRLEYCLKICGLIGRGIQRDLTHLVLRNKTCIKTHIFTLMKGSKPYLESWLEPVRNYSLATA